MQPEYVFLSQLLVLTLGIDSGINRSDVAIEMEEGWLFVLWNSLLQITYL